MPDGQMPSTLLLPKNNHSLEAVVWIHDCEQAANPNYTPSHVCVHRHTCSSSEPCASIPIPDLSHLSLMLMLIKLTFFAKTCFIGSGGRGQVARSGTQSSHWI